MDKDGTNRKTILAVLILILFISIAGNIIAVLFISGNGSLSKGIINNGIITRDNLESLNDDFLRQCSAVYYVLFLDNQEEIADVKDRISDYDAKMEESFRNIGISVKNGEEINALSSAQAKLEEYKKVRDDVISYHKNKDRQKALELLKEALVPAASELDEVLMSLNQQFSAGLENAEASAEQSSRYCIFTLMGLSILSITAFLACFAAAKQWITRKAGIGQGRD